MSVKKEYILANCIDEVLSGRRTIEDCVARYPELGAELRALLEIATGIQPEVVAPTAEFKARARNRLLEAMQPFSGRPSAGFALSRWFKLRLPARALQVATVVVTVLLLVMASGAGTVYGAQSSLPGDTLYPVKIGWGNIQLAMAQDGGTRAVMRLGLARDRLDEIVALSNLSRDIDPSVVNNAAAQIDQALGEMERAQPEEVKTFSGRLSESTLNRQVTLNQILATAPQAAQPAVEQALEVTRRGNVIAQLAYANPAFLESRPSVWDKGLEEGQFELDGILLSADNRTWNVGGIIIDNVAAAGELPPVGSRVKVEGVKRDNRTFVIKSRPSEKTDEKVKIVGRFEGTSPDGTTWHVSGLPIEVSREGTPPPKGDKTKLYAEVHDGNRAVAQVQAEKEDEEEEEGAVSAKGGLAQVDSRNNSITINVAGAPFRIQVGEAQIKTGDGQPLELSDLKSLVGKEVKVGGLYEKAGRLYVRKVHVDAERKQKDDDEKGRRDRDEKSQPAREREEGKETPIVTATPAPSPTAIPAPSPMPPATATPARAGESERERRDRDERSQPEREREEGKEIPTVTPTPAPSPTAIPAPSPRPPATATPARSEESERDRRDGDEKSQSEREREEGRGTTTPTSSPTAIPTLTPRPTATPTPARSAESERDRRDGDEKSQPEREREEGKETATPTPTPTPRPTATPTLTPRPTPGPRATAIATPQKAESSEEDEDDRDWGSQPSRPTATSTPRPRPTATPTPARSGESDED